MNTEFRYCKNCLMPNTRPNIKFNDDGICAPCVNYKKQDHTNWDQRFAELEILCDKYRGKNGNGYDCAIAVSGGKDSHFQVYFMKEVMKMNPVLLSVSNLDWTETGRKNLKNLSDTFSCDIIMQQPNFNISRILAKKAFIEIGSPTWLWDALGYAFPWRMAMNLGLKFLIYGENVSYTYGGVDDEETPWATLQSKNNVVKPEWDRWLSDVSEKELNSAKLVTPEEAQAFKMEAIYLSYFTGWDSYRNYEIAKKFGFQTLHGEYTRENTIEQFNQIDTLSYLVNQALKYQKFATGSATDIASRLIRAGLKTREEMIPIVKEKDGIMDQKTAELFMEFTHMKPKEFYETVDKWYNPNLFKKDKWGIWRPKFEVGVGLIEN